jgi:LysM repeat protein
MTKQSTGSSAPPPRLCPTCGTRVGELATKCIVCGADLGGPAATAAKPQRQWRSLLPERPRLGAARPVPPASQPGSPPPPTASASTGAPINTGVSTNTRGRGITLPLPLAIGLIIVFVLMGAVLMIGASGVLGGSDTPTPTITLTITPTGTFTLAPTPTNTQLPTATPLPPIEYTVVGGDSCISIAVQFDISLQTLLDVNGLVQACPLVIGQKLQVPQPTYTATAPPSNTPEPGGLTETARPRSTYTVQAGDTLFSIAANNNVDYIALAEENGIPGPDYAISVGQVLTIPLDRPPATAGPSPTATGLPPYPAPALLSPPNGAAVSPVEQTVVLQWAAVDVLQEGESYLVTVEDLTCNCAKRLQEPVNQTRYIVNVEMKPAEAAPHIFRWTVVTVRQTGTTTDGKPIYEPAGATSEERTFTWTGIGLPTTPTPGPTTSP